MSRAALCPATEGGRALDGGTSRPRIRAPLISVLCNDFHLIDFSDVDTRTAACGRPLVKSHFQRSLRTVTVSALLRRTNPIACASVARRQFASGAADDHRFRPSVRPSSPHTRVGSGILAARVVAASAPTQGQCLSPHISYSAHYVVRPNSCNLHARTGKLRT